MTLEREDLEHLIADDLRLRNRNYEAIEEKLNRLDQFITEMENTYSKRIIDSGSKREGNSSHFYEIYADNTAKAWGVIEMTVDFNSPIGGLYRTAAVEFGNMIDFIRDDRLVVLCHVAGVNGNPSYNVLPMSTNSANPMQARLLVINTAERLGVTIRLHYQITGEPNV